MELSKHYIPASVEEKWYRHWLQKRYFNSQPNDGKPPFTVVIPPPNVTGVLHMGHTLNETVQDILIRKARMSGFNACWVPGSDHASIATEARVVNMLKERGIDKTQLTREKFLEYAFEWKEKYGGIIYSQIAKLGCSVDWDRVSFTMDPDYYKAVIKVFIDLYKKGLIYRGARMIHWDPSAKTALSDEEVEYKEVEGKLYYVKYMIADDSSQMTDDSNTPVNSQPSTVNYIAIATQRPETIMGDTAVCVNPSDERYLHLKGKSVIVPLVNRKVPVVFDEYVDKEFGTGALKITPAHDINDYNLGLKHNLAVIDTLNEDGTLSKAAEVFVGMDRFAARKKVIEALSAEGLLIKEENYTTRLGFSQRTNAVVEPRISTQWFVKMKEMATPALKAVLEGDIKIYPGEKFLATYKYWLENVKDWCISRQLWWGQRIPAWYDEKGNFVVAENIDEALREWKVVYNKSAVGSELRQDEDVLDTWFSSWLWPIEVFKGITNPGNKDIKYYYPTTVLVTGQDIIFFWVARMIMAGMEYMKQKPFSDVYFTGMVRDKQGRKMSKSLGNSPDLLELIDKYGADAVRFGILISSPAGNDLLFDEASLEQGRNFNNKIWNALKLVKMWEPRVEHSSSPIDSFATDWFQNRLNETRLEIEKLFKEYKLSETLKIIYSLIWDDFCSWYLEWVKPALNAPIEATVYNKTVYFFEQLLQLLHPYMPFITEEIYHLLKERNDNDDLCMKQFEQISETINVEVLDNAAQLKKDITAIREARTKNQIKGSEKIKFSLEHFLRKFFLNNPEILKLLEKQTNSEFSEEQLRGEHVLKTLSNEIIVFSSGNKFYLHLDKELDSSKQKTDLQKELEYFKGFLQSVNQKLSNERFIKNAKPEVIAIEQKKKTDTEAKIKTLEESLAQL